MKIDMKNPFGKKSNNNFVPGHFNHQFV